MSLQVPVPLKTLDEYNLSQTLKDITRRAVDGTVIPLFVDSVSNRVLIGTVVASGPEILQINGSAFITGRLKTGSIFTQDLAAAGCVWAGSLVANATIQAGGANIYGTLLLSGAATVNGGIVTTNIILRSRDGKHTGRLILENPDASGDMALGIDVLT